MTGQILDEPGGPGPMPAVAEDPEVAALVRAAAAAWTMPPRTIGADPWRERVRAGGRRRVARMLVATAAAIAAVFVVAVGAAVLLSPPTADVTGPSAPPSDAAVGPSATSGPTTEPGSPSPNASVSTGPAATPLPAYVSFGPPPVGLTVAGTVDGGWRVIDMATGASSDPIAIPYLSGNRVFALADGTYLCACVVVSPGDLATRIEVVVRRYDAAGRPGAEVARLAYAGTAGAPGDDDGTPVAIDATLSAGGVTLAVGWSTWDGSSWHAGVDAVDITTGAVAHGEELPVLPGTVDATVDLPSRWDGYAESDGPLVAWPPTAWISPDGERMVLRRALSAAGAPVRVEWWSADGPGSTSADATAPLGGSSVPDEAPCAQGDSGYAGWTAPAVFSLLCVTPTRADVLRFDPMGGALGGVDLAAESAVSVWPLVGPAVADVGTGTLYLWDPFSSRVAAIDTVGGRVARSATVAWGPAAAAEDAEPIGSFVRGLLRSLVPRAAAKVLLGPAMALAPDGGTLYLLGTTAAAIEAPDSRSTGIAVVDAATFAVRDRWAPPADLTSIVVSADGRHVVAAGMPGVDATGADAPWEASLAVWDAATGRLVAIAGRLGGSWIEVAQPEHGD
jgi:hypothetical protein